MPTELVVRAAGLAPVKGMRHLALERMDLDEHGPVGDHQWCLVDVRARRVLRTVQHPSLIAVAARVEGDRLALTLPSGEGATSLPEETGEMLTCDYWGRQVPLALTDGPHAALMSGYLGRDVRLAAAPRGGVVFAAAVTIVGTASLDALAAQAGRPVDSSRFRPNLVVETDEPWAEDSWLGREVRVGEALIRIGGPVPRCVVIDHHPVTSEKDVRLLKQLVGSRPTNRAGEPMFGRYAEVVRAGVVTTAP
jgi:uncharacterized protein